MQKFFEFDRVQLKEHGKNIWGCGKEEWYLVRHDSSDNKKSEDDDDSKYDYIVDCIDTISAKIDIIRKAKEFNKEIISCMGTGNKLDPFSFRIADINQTSMCPLARTMRYELKKRDIKNVKVLYSLEKNEAGVIYDETKGKAIPGSIAYVPSVAGLMIASYVINSIIK